MSFVRRVACAALAIGLAPMCAQAEIGRDDQWTYVAAGRHGGPAAELRGDKFRPADTLLFRISCERSARTLVVEYFPDEGFDQLLAEVRAEPLALDLDARAASMPTQRKGRLLIGRLELHPALVRDIEGAEEIFLYGPNDMGEGWYAGAARPLRRVARECL